MDRSMADMAHFMSQACQKAAEEKVTTRGTPQSLTRSDVLAVLTARGLDLFDVRLCPGETGVE
eukprot:6888176-Heterocapsa_arctica.AAC.1